MAATRPRASVVVLAAALDVALVAVFVLIGRGAHDEALTPGGIGETWWPFLAGLAVGWLIAQGWRKPFGVIIPGLVIWATTVVIGMLLRVLSGQGVQLPFVIVATVTIALFLLGWRAIATVIVRSRRSGGRLRADSRDEVDGGGQHH